VSNEPEQKSESTQTVTPAEDANSQNQASASQKTPFGRPAGARKPPTSQAVKRSTKTCPGFFSNDTPYLLAQAERDAGSGKYSEASHAYQLVLCLDPGNTSAKAGLQKVMRAAELNRQ
jgi:hypothetical protein